MDSSYWVSGLIWLTAVSLLGLYEWWAIATAHHTLSQWVWFAQRRHRWLRWVIAAGLLVLTYHFWAE
jgi:hypothetical protein